MGWTYYDDYPKGRKGFEARYRIVNRTLCIEADGSDSRYDWIRNFIGAIGKTESGYHRAWFEYAVRFTQHLKQYEGEFDYVVAFGHSMGAAVLSFLPLFMPVFCNIAGYGAPKSGCTKYLSNMRHKWDVVTWLPPWTKKYKDSYVIGKKFSFNFAKTHNSYDWRIPVEDWAVINE